MPGSPVRIVAVEAWPLRIPLLQPMRLASETIAVAETLLVRDTVATARGIIMGQQNVTEDEALTYLLNRAGNEGLSLHELAQSVLRRGARPDTPHEAP